MEDLVRFYKSKNVFVTGHTGFKGTWLVRILELLGANVTGYSLENGDIRNFTHLKAAFDIANPEIIFHLAAQPIVRESYVNPVYTFETNVLGTVNVLECARLSDTVRTVLNVTTDKVYAEFENSVWGYRENDALGGFEPYSTSKACSELVTQSYYRSFLKDKGIAASTARAGNVIGGGDRGKDRIIPDCVNAITKGEKIIVRNPNSTRPYQHVLEALYAYLLVAQSGLSDCFNVGPENENMVTTGELCDLFCEQWSDGASWETKEDKRYREADFLKLDNSKAKKFLMFYPKWNILTSIKKTVEWEKANLEGNDITEVQIREYFDV